METQGTDYTRDFAFLGLCEQLCVEGFAQKKGVAQVAFLAISEEMLTS